MTKAALTIAGSDPSGGAGIQADLKTFHQFGVYGTSAITLLTVQNTQEVRDVHVLDPAFVREQIEAVVSDIPPDAAKTGALGSTAMIEMVAERARSFDCPLVVDPVLISKHGAPLLDEDAREELVRLLLPRAAIVTPNLHEAEAITGKPVRTVEQMEDGAKRIADLGASAVVVKGGHLLDRAVDVLVCEQSVHHLESDRIATNNTHGTGCAFSAAITARLALGDAIEQAVICAKKFITEAIRTNPALGRGYGPLNLHTSSEQDIS